MRIEGTFRIRGARKLGREQKGCAEDWGESKKAARKLRREQKGDARGVGEGLSPHFSRAPNAKNPSRGPNFARVERERLLRRLILY